MDKKGIFIQIGEFEEKVKGLHEEFQKFKEQLVPLIEENHWLHIENKKLRERLEELQGQHVKKEDGRSRKKPLVGEGYDNLARLYQEGFHICSTQYGGLRSDGEDCLFCLSFLQQK